MVPADSDPCSTLLASVPQGLVLVKSSLDCPADFLLPWLTRSSIAAGGKVLVVTAASSASRHRAALRKAGAAAAAAGSGAPAALDQSVAWVSPLSQAPPSAAAAADAVASSSSSGDGCSGSGATFLPSLQALLLEVLAAAQRLGGEHLLLVVDSWTALCCLYPCRQQQDAFQHYLATIQLHLQVPATVVVLAACDVPGAGAQLVAWEHAAAATVQLRAVEGRTGGLDGQLHLLLRRGAAGGARQVPGGGALQQPGAAAWFYRCGDTGVGWLPEIGGGREMLMMG